VLHLDPLADHRAGADEDVLPEHGARADAGGAAHVDEVPDLDVLAEDGALVDDGARVDIGSAHASPAISTAAPPASSERCPASRARTTARPERPSETGAWRVRIASRKASHSRRSGSCMRSAGMRISPVRTRTPSA